MPIQLLIHESKSSQQKMKRRKEICKEIQKLTRKKIRKEKTEKIELILSEFRGLKEISCIKDQKKKKMITIMIDKNGEEKDERKSIAEVFAAFYEDLYRSRQSKQVRANVGTRKNLPKFSMEELKDSLKMMKRGKAKDSQGVVAEMLKDGGDDLLECILDMFNDLLGPDSEPSKTWKETKLVVIFKKGDPRMAANYRPIAIVPILYKLFSRMICTRISERLMPQQSVEQAAYRKDFSTQDHLLTMTLLFEKSREWNAALWVGLVDFEKAFDSVEHEALWEALREESVEEEYIELVRKLYEGQTATVQTDVRSRKFSLTRGVKQGDPISGLLFIAVLEACMRRLKEKWGRLNARRIQHGYGIPVDSPKDPLMNLRFADDILLIAQSQSDIRKMLKDLKAEAEKYGLKMHMGKTKILRNEAATCKDSSVQIGGEDVKILGIEESERYLGRKLCLGDYHGTEIKNRISAGWAAFMKHREELCSKHYHIKDRMKLFEAVVTPCVLYAAGTWTMYKEYENLLRVTRRKMLRMIFRSRRQAKKTHVESDAGDQGDESRDSYSSTGTGSESSSASSDSSTTASEKEDEEILEHWHEWLQRVTRGLEKQAFLLNSEDWVVKQRKAKHELAGHILRRTDGRWAQRILSSKLPLSGARKQGAPNKRWQDEFEENYGDWQSIAMDRDSWRLNKDHFVGEERAEMF